MSKPSPIVNFEKTLAQLKQFCAMPVLNDRDRAGIIQAFDFTFEQAWLAIQKKAGPLGLRAPSPRQAFTIALQQSWILSADEMMWLKMIEDRNLTSHTYKQTLAEEVLERIMRQYLKLFEGLIQKLR